MHQVGGGNNNYSFYEAVSVLNNVYWDRALGCLEEEARRNLLLLLPIFSSVKEQERLDHRVPRLGKSTS